MKNLNNLCILTVDPNYSKPGIYDILFTLHRNKRISELLWDFEPTTTYNIYKNCEPIFPLWEIDYVEKICIQYLKHSYKGLCLGSQEPIKKFNKEIFKDNKISLLVVPQIRVPDSGRRCGFRIISDKEHYVYDIDHGLLSIIKQKNFKLPV